MLTVNKVNEIMDSLKHQANIELSEAVAYHNGYMRACEDFGRQIRQMLYEQNEED